MSDFSLERIVRPNILALAPYRCARDDYSEGILLDANENSYGPSLSDTSISDLPNLERYPDPLHNEIKERLCLLRDLPSPKNLFLGVGSDEAIDLLVRIFCVPGKDKILVTPPTYGMYSVCAQVNDVGVVKVPLNLDDGKFQLQTDKVLESLEQNPDVKIVFLCSPGNPTGSLLAKEDVQKILTFPGYQGIVIVDEAYIDFVETDKGSSTAPWVTKYPNLVVLQTLSKSFGLAGIRVGIAASTPEIIALMNNTKAPYNICSLSAQVALSALQDSSIDLMKSRVQKVREERKKLIEKVVKIPGIGLVKGTNDANFVLVEVLDKENKVPCNERATKIYTYLAEERGIVIRLRCKEPGCLGCLRITIGTPEENVKLLQELEEALKLF
ncbi:histidinol-phosphate aminotransferase [Basidiobolus meristosporus CBS 931.73]|uniref:histidinol-phosphate transaminase n=1 Tax=Basidiobolus meristosporus CBS 931.73 TaxID=1314790 RepID=A0A1Y1Y5Q3_9FUNG|nr:histidinol-phosphate aminotransferase [Basidiobolus meristosporus CBS 931.73]|eukprot:ORX93323.1 histidinol-phosphate aminotransferase [Basidiobolus meristosporus CBS 931.73]